MEIGKLRLVNYRNYADETFTFSEGINIIHGSNGQGKTNLLESIFLLNRGYSHRSTRAAELIRFGEHGFFLSSSFRSGETAHRLALKVENGRKAYKLDGTVERSFSKIERLTGCILFEPNDLEIVKAGPVRRRRFIDEELSGLSPGYRENLKGYKRALAQRNAALKGFRKNPTDRAVMTAVLAPWEEQLITTGSAICTERTEYLTRLAREASPFHARLSGTGECLGLAYKTNVYEKPEDVPNIRSLYRTRLSAGLDTDLYRGFTTLGPHADDMDILVNQKPARLFASQGQQRTAAISLKLSHVALYQEKEHCTPVVLLDDILSELDDRRQENILSVLNGTQSFITCTDPAFASRFTGAKKIYIAGGSKGEE